MKILTLNCGSSSVKYLVYDWDEKKALARGIVERIIIGNSFIRQSVPGRKEFKKEKDCPGHKEAIQLILETITDQRNGILTDISEISAVGHRVVHGGEKFTHSIKIDKEAIKTFKELSDLAPLHNPPNIVGIESAMSILPDIPHIAVMDTAFHQTMPEYVYIYPIPYEWYEKYGIRRYGFHGTSHLYVSKRAAVMLDKSPDKINLITCHIGNGVSSTAIKNGMSFDQSMGFTPLEGLVMGTRSGDIDPAIIGFISVREGLRAREVITILNKKSGILGITGRYTDRRDVQKAMDKGEKRAKLAFDIEAYRIKKYIGAYTAALGKVDAVVFTAGAGEKDWRLREKSLINLENIGIILDKERNENAVKGEEMLISADNSPVKVFVIPTDEEIVFIEDVVAIMEGRYDIHTKFKYSFQENDYKRK